jgi:acyl dehydratase
VDAVGAARVLDTPPPLPASPATDGARARVDVFIPPHAPHVYTECADIYNPIHTEHAVALAAGLPDIIVHGTLILAYAVREVINHEAGADPERLARVSCRFAGMVIPGTTMHVQFDHVMEYDDGRAVFFRVSNAQHAIAVREGVAFLAAP